MKVYQAKVWIKNGPGKVAHTVQIQASSTFSAQQHLYTLYGKENLIGVPTEVRTSTKYTPSWMR